MEKLEESLDSKLEKLLRLGLADRKRLDFYRRILSNTKQNVNNAEYRPVIVDVLNKLINNTIKDPTIYNKTQQNLMAGRYINEAKIKKKNVISPTQRVASIKWHPETSDMEQPIKETSMHKIQLIKELVAERNLNEAMRRGTNLGRRSTGTVAAAEHGRPRKATRKARASSDAVNDSLVMKARARILKAQRALAKKRQLTARTDRREQDFYQKQKQVQQMGQIY